MPNTPVMEKILEYRTKFDNCPECDGKIGLKSRSNVKGLITVYGRNGPSLGRHLEYRYFTKLG